MSVSVIAQNSVLVCEAQRKGMGAGTGLTLLDL